MTRISNYVLVYTIVSLVAQQNVFAKTFYSCDLEKIPFGFNHVYDSNSNYESCFNNYKENGNFDDDSCYYFLKDVRYFIEKFQQCPVKNSAYLNDVAAAIVKERDMKNGN